MVKLSRRIGRSVTSIGRAVRFARQQGAVAAVRRVRADRLPFSPVSDSAYRLWMQQRASAPRASATVPALERVSLLVPLHESKREHVAELYESVRAQSHGNWELSFCADGPLRSEVSSLLKELARQDYRVQVLERGHQPGISSATNAALRASSGGLIGLLDHDDLLAPDALEEAARRFHEDPELDLLYTDEDMLSSRGDRRSPLLKPGFSPTLLLGTNYVMHLVVLRRAHLEELGGLRSEFDGAQDHDLLLRSFESARKVQHLSLIAYHWRAGQTSVASGSGAKPWAYERGRCAVEAACVRRKLPVSRVTHSAIPGLYGLELEALETRLPVHVLLHGLPAACARWSRALEKNPDGLQVRSISLGVWPQGVTSGESVLIIDGRVSPNARALTELSRWAAYPGVSSVASMGRSRWLPAPTGFSVSRAGRAHPMPALTIHARLPHEIAAPSAGMLLLLRPDSARMQALSGCPFARVDAACMGLAAWTQNLRSVFVPIPHLRPRLQEPLDMAELDLTASTLWPGVQSELPESFWSDGADRFGRRHPLLTPLGMPPPC